MAMVVVIMHASTCKQRRIALIAVTVMLFSGTAYCLRINMTANLRPELIWIEGRCYRVNDPTTEITTLQEHDLYENDIAYNCKLDEGDDEDEFEVVMVDNSRYKTSLNVSKHYLGAIIGKKGSIKSRIERDTKTDIKIPRHRQEGDITILGSTAANVKAARRRINIIVMSSRMKQNPTHFLSIPMNNPDIMKRFEEFKTSVLHECAGSRGLDESIFIESYKLHLTLGVMCLMDNEERLFASKLLTEAKDKVVEPIVRGLLPLKIRLKGLSYMNDDPSQIDVLYGTVQEEDPHHKGLIQRVADGLVEHFYKAGYMDRQHGRDNVKLHVTLINSKYRSRHASGTVEGSGATRNSRRQRESFDGTKVLAKFSDYDFGMIELKNIHLSQRHSVGPDGYYQSTCVIAL